MVLNLKKIKKIVLILNIVIFCHKLSAKNTASTIEFWPDIFQTAFINNTKVTRLINEYQSSLVQKKQYDYSWFPIIQTGIQNNLNLRRSDYVYILNQSKYTDGNHAIILSPTTSISVIQKLPGNGQLSLSADYSFSYLIKKNSFIQYPNLELSFKQSLSRGALGINKDSELLMLKEQIHYNRLILEKNLFDELKNTILLISNADIFYAQEEYYAALVRQYENEADTAQKKKESGLQSGLEAFYAVHQYADAYEKYNSILYNKNTNLKELHLIIPNFDYTEIKTKRNELLSFMLRILEAIEFNSQEKIETTLTTNYDSQIYSNILEQYRYQYQYEDKQSAPIFYLTSSINPDNNFNSYYSDWYKSFRILNQRPCPINFSLNIGIYKSFELPNAKKLRKEIYNLYYDSIMTEMEMNQNSQKKELAILLNQIKIDSEYLNNLEQQLSDEDSFRKDRILLFSQELITGNDFYKSETMYYLIYSDYVNTFWNIIKNQLDVIEICAGNNKLMNELLGDTYEKMF